MKKRITRFFASFIVIQYNSQQQNIAIMSNAHAWLPRRTICIPITVAQFQQDDLDAKYENGKRRSCLRCSYDHRLFRNVEIALYGRSLAYPY